MELKKREMGIQKLKPANFIKVDIDIVEEPTVTFWVGILTMLPFPIIILKMFSGLAAKLVTQYTDYEITQQELLDILNSMNGLDVQIETKDANINVKVY